MKTKTKIIMAIGLVGLLDTVAVLPFLIRNYGGEIWAVPITLSAFVFSYLIWAAPVYEMIEDRGKPW